MNKAVFFDRDDTLIRNIPYLGDPKQVRLLPGVRRALQRLSAQGFLLFIVSNQSGVGRGLITPAQVAAVNEAIVRRLGRKRFADILVCFDSPDGPQSGCRKPEPGMLLRAQKKFDLSLSRSFMVGDNAADIEAGRRAGCRTALVIHPHTKEEAIEQADFSSASMAEIIDWILQLDTARPMS